MEPTDPSKTLIDTHVIVRSTGSGVHHGILTARDGDEVVLANSRRVYRWKIDYIKHNTSQVTCSELALYGPHGDSRLSPPVGVQVVLGVVEILATTPEATAAIEGWPS